MLGLYDRQLDLDLENCLGKHSDSYEYSLEVFTEHLKNLRLSNVIKHSQPLDPGVKRDHSYLMGGDNTAEPVYNMPSGQRNGL